MSADHTVLDSVVSARTPWLVDVVATFTHTGGTVAMWLASAAVVAALVFRQRLGDAAFVAATMAAGMLLMSGLKRVFQRERPPIPERLVELDSYSFPSGHSMMTAVFAVVIAIVLARSAPPPATLRTCWALLALFTFAIGYSRIYLGAHWLTDVLAGWTLGVLLALASAWIYRTGRLRVR